MAVFLEPRSLKCKSPTEQPRWSRGESKNQPCVVAQVPDWWPFRPPPRAVGFGWWRAPMSERILGLSDFLGGRLIPPAKI